MHFNAKKIFLVIFFLLLLGGIPAAVYMLQQQQILKQQAEKSTNFSFSPDSSPSSPITKKVGDDVVLDVMIDPGTNVITSVNIEIQYDPDKLELGDDAFEIEPIFSVFTEPIYQPGKIIATLNITDPSKALQTKTKAATVTFSAIDPTETGTPTKVTYTSNSNATSSGPNDSFTEDVLEGTSPALIVINEAVEPTATPEPTDVPQPTNSPEPTDSVSNSAPACSALTADQTSGAAPFSVNFTANGTDSDGTISKVTFNFGDGQVSDVTSGGGIGSNSASVQLAHVYSSSGTFRATAIFTDNNGGISGGNCSQTISVSGNEAPTPTPTIAPAGSVEVLFGIGAASLLLMIGGGLLFLIL